MITALVTLLANQTERSTPLAVYVPLIILGFLVFLFFTIRAGRSRRSARQLRDGEAISVDYNE